MMKADRIRAQITVSREAKTLAIIISILGPFGHYDVEKILKTVCGYFGLRCERQQ